MNLFYCDIYSFIAAFKTFIQMAIKLELQKKNLAKRRICNIIYYNKYLRKGELQILIT